jgi:hypothetical protein
MNLIITIMLLFIVLLVLVKVYDINTRKLKQFVEYEEIKFNKLVEKYPSNIEICKSILKKINNKDVKIEEDKNSKTCLYIVQTNKIVIADVKNSYTRIQTIAHECLHSIQKRKILLFNFIFSNVYLLYFIIVGIFAITNKIQDSMLYISIMILLSYIYYFIRSYLEDDAMLKARFLAEDYMKEVNISSKEEIENIIKSYDKINDVGIRTVNFQLMLGTLLKTIILTIAFLI